MEDISLLKKIDFLKGLTTMELTKISRICKQVSFDKGVEILKEGEEGNSLFIIKKGSVRVIKGDRMINALAEGSPVGEVSFIDKGPSSATVVTDKDTALIEIPVHALESILKKDTNIAHKVYKSISEILCRRLRFSNDMLLLLSSD